MKGGGGGLVVDRLRAAAAPRSPSGTLCDSLQLAVCLSHPITRR